MYVTSPSRSSRRGRTWMNIVPLIDVLIVLLFFFITTMQFKHVDNFNIIPPKIETAGPTTPENHVFIAITKDQQFFFNNQPLTPQDLIQAIQDTAQNHPGQNILLIADEDTPLKSITWAMDQCRKCKLYQIKLQSR
jgi:biopolymer transport protein ExbD